MKSLSPRQQAILNRIVETHIETAQPVGSRFITSLYTEIYGNSYSSATVRNEMGVLEEQGYLTHPHTSAGRIPTDYGYRYYVDHSLQAEPISEDQVKRMSDELCRASEAIEVFAEKVSEILSNLSEEISVTATLKENAGGRRSQVFLQGTSRMLEKPEFQSFEKVKALLKVLDEKAELAEWLLKHRGGESKISLTIGRENNNPSLNDCTVISSHYRLPGSSGAIAIIGPCRMRYNRMLPLVTRMSRIVEEILSSSAGDFE